MTVRCLKLVFTPEINVLQAFKNLQASECGIKLDAIISNSCFFLMMNMVACMKDLLKGNIIFNYASRFS